MFVLSTNVNAGYKAIATLVAVAMVMGAFGFYNYAQAANVTNVSDVLSDSGNSALSNHTIQFKSPTGITNGQTVGITFPAGFTIGSTAFGDIDVATSSAAANMTIAANCAGTEKIGAAFAGQVLTLTFCPGDGGFVSANGTTTIKIGTNATFGGTGTNRIGNPSTTGSYQLDIAGTMADSGHTRVAILPTVLVTARVDTTFTFTVTGVATSTAVNGTTTTRTSSSTTIPFGKLVANQMTTLAQNLAVQTNAINGFVVTVKESQHLLSSTGADIDNFANGVESATPVAWSAPTNNIALENTWGHWGVTSQDTATTRSVQFGSNQWTGVSTTPQVIFSHTGPADGVTAGIGSTRIGYQVQITPLQEAGDDYSTVLTYVATPTF